MGTGSLNHDEGAPRPGDDPDDPKVPSEGTGSSASPHPPERAAFPRKGGPPPIPQRPPVAPRPHWGALVIGCLTFPAVVALAVQLLTYSNGYRGGGLFLVAPLLAGFLTGLCTATRKDLWLMGAIGFLLSCAYLVQYVREGTCCLVMATPIILLGFYVGGMVGVAGRRRLRRKGRGPLRTMMFCSLGGPILLVGVRSVEEPMHREVRIERVEHVVQIAASPAQVWETLLTMDGVSGKQPLLMQLGLPVPTHCALNGEGVGAERVCYFEGGEMTQRVSVWEPGTALSVEVTGCTLAGRDWLEFHDAGYRLQAHRNGTRVTRYTVYQSRLMPGFYWRFMEAQGVKALHDFVLDNLQREAERR